MGAGSVETSGRGLATENTENTENTEDTEKDQNLFSVSSVISVAYFAFSVHQRSALTLAFSRGTGRGD